MKNLIRIICFIFLGTLLGFGQERLLNQADEQYGAFAFKPAQDIYLRVLERGYVSADLLQKLGDTYYYNADYQKAGDIYKRLIAEYPNDFAPVYYFRYAQTLRSANAYGEADKMMQQFFTLTREQGGDLQQTMMDRDFQKEITENSGRFNLKDFKYNSRYSDFAPAFYKKGLIFSSDRDTGNLARYRHSWNAMDFLDLYKVNADSISEEKVSKLENINSRYHESSSVLSPDGSTLYFTRNNYAEGEAKKDEQGVVRLKVYKAKMVDGLWTDVEPLPFNSDAYSVAHPAISPDGKTLYFASDMPGTLGQSDLFKVPIRSDGTYGKPENLGSKINTSGRETFPYVSADNILYFASDGHVGLGGLDIFAVKLAQLPFAGKVLNVGAPVNSTQDDFTFIMDADSREGYFASSREEGKGGDDIYAFVETRPLQFDCIQPISGTVRDKITNEVLAGATVKVIDESNTELESAITDASGNYEITLDCTQGNFVRASRQGYVPAEEYLTPSDGKPRVIDFYLEPETVVAGFGDDLAKLLQLSTIYFDFDKYNIRPDAEVEIQKIIAAMEKYPSLKIKANSHTDSRGPAAYNLWLSQKRAEATVNYMISKGISAERLVGEGFGESQLINECSDGVRCPAEKHDRNRRSEFIIFE
ncbi:OmpA family protein [Robiginitalea sp. IMCC44478]|uniref:OmpA family protein n=1 Tax=Robiginitalea sp. IMCC44478 TaxID=3459122 RepID=UPI0040414C85